MARLGVLVAAALVALGSTTVQAATTTQPAKKKAPAAAQAKMPPAPPAPGSGGASAETSTDKLRQAAQNPVANMISLPLQNNSNFDFGQYGRPQNVLNVQPVIPFKITPDWNLVTRWVTPVIWQPRTSPLLGGKTGLGNIQPSFFLSPADPGKFIWGAGPVFWLPTASGQMLGVNKWGAGPSAVVLRIEEHWVYGALVNNIWAGTENRRVNQMLIQPFVNYNMADGWYLTSVPAITANWLAKSGDRWTVPIGGGFGRLFKVDKLPINAQIQAFYNVVRPNDGPTWTLRFQVQALFPTF